MKERFIEIRFYYYCLDLLKALNFSVNILDLIDTYCLLSGADSSIIKLLVKQIREGKTRIKPYRDEVIYIARVLKISYRALEKISGISAASQTRSSERVMRDSYLYESLTHKLNDIEYDSVERFMNLVDKLKEI